MTSNLMNRDEWNLSIKKLQHLLQLVITFFRVRLGALNPNHTILIVQN